MLQAKGDYKLFMDADGSTPMEEIEKLFPSGLSGQARAYLMSSLASKDVQK